MHRPLTALVVLAPCLAASPALADQIIGKWCPPNGDKSLLVRNNNEVAFSGQPVKANVDDHNVDFDMPPGEPDAGKKFRANQLNHEQISVTIGQKHAVIWRLCTPVS